MSDRMYMSLPKKQMLSMQLSQMVPPPMPPPERGFDWNKLVNLKWGGGKLKHCKGKICRNETQDGLNYFKSCAVHGIF
jgi:hypothetical protein